MRIDDLNAPHAGTGATVGSTTMALGLTVTSIQDGTFLLARLPGLADLDLSASLRAGAFPGTFPAAYAPRACGAGRRAAPGTAALPCARIVYTIQSSVLPVPRPPTVAEGVYLHLRRELLAGRLEAGRRLREQEVAEALAVSRTPVREAVRRLAQEGLLELEANRGVRVPMLRPEEAVATYEVRERLERMAARLAARHAGEAGRDEVRARLAAMEALVDDDLAHHVQADDAFHLAIARSSGNPVLAELVERLADRVARVKVLTRDLNVSAMARAQHREIADAILSGDEHRAERAMSHHIRTNLAIVVERLAAIAAAAAPEGALP